MPEMSVCPVSSSVRTRKVGSSSVSRWRPAPSLSWSPFVFGSIATEITGSGNSIDSRRIGAVSMASVSPVEVFLSPTMAAISPAPMSSRSSRELACIWRMRPIRSVLPVVTLRTRSPALHLARVDAGVREPADVRVGHDLEGERAERLVERGAPRELVLGARVEPVDRRHVERARQVVDDGVEQRLHALVLEGGAEQDRRDGDVERRRAERAPEHVRRDRGLVFEIGLQQLVVVVGDRVDQLVVVLVRLLEQLRRDLAHVHVLAEVVLVGDRPHLDQVDDAAEVLLRADRQLHRNRARAEAVDHGLHRGEEVRARAVHLVHERDARNLVAVGLAPDGLGLRLDARDRVEDRDRAVEDAQASLHLDRKVHVPGRIDNVDAKVPPERRRRGRRDRDPALLLLRHPVHDRCALVDLAHLVGAAGVVEDPLGRRRLARVDVGHDPDVADALERRRCLGGRLSHGGYQR